MTQLSKEEAARRVARGAAWLDRTHPGWDKRIDLGNLDMANRQISSGGACILCQLGNGRSFGAAVQDLFGPDTTYGQVIDGGFLSLSYEVPPDRALGDRRPIAVSGNYLDVLPAYRLLDAEWTALIRARRAAAAKNAAEPEPAEVALPEMALVAR